MVWLKEAVVTKHNVDLTIPAFTNGKLYSASMIYKFKYHVCEPTQQKGPLSQNIEEQRGKY